MTVEFTFHAWMVVPAIMTFSLVLCALHDVKNGDFNMDRLLAFLAIWASWVGPVFAAVILRGPQ
jgi:hypothetical protein